MEQISKNPKISVIMPNYNNELYLREAIESVLNQTFKDFEFIIVDDGSTDKSIEIIQSYNDPRIKIFINEINKGVSYTKNVGLDAAKGEYIIILDSDDICHPERLEKQVKFMDKHPDIGVLGTLCLYFNKDKTLYEVDHFPSDPDFLKALLIYDCSIHQPTVIMRKDVLNRHNLRYDVDIRYGEDYDFW